MKPFTGLKNQRSMKGRDRDKNPGPRTGEVKGMIARDMKRRHATDCRSSGRSSSGR